MRRETSTTHSIIQTDPYHSVRCSAQVLVVDRRGGPASVLMDTLSRLFDGNFSLTEVDRRFDVLHVMDCFCFDLVVIGVDTDHLVELTLLPEITRMRPDVPVLVVGTQVPRFFTQYARHYGAREVFDLPGRAAELRSAAERVSRYVEDTSLACAG